MDVELRRRVEQNIFHKSRPSVEPWEHFRWHPSKKACDTWKSHSSQALSIDLFGYLKQAPKEVRTSACNLLAELAGYQTDTDWRIELEWQDPCRLLQESRHPTQVDALLEAEETMLFIECKFTESQAGACGQPRKIAKGQKKGLIQCSGSYLMQLNPTNGISSRCPLSGKGIRYWEIVRNVMTIDPDSNYQICPFQGSNYQWMRNLTTAYAVASNRGRKAAFILMYADSPELPIANEVRSPHWEEIKSLTTGVVPICAVSFQSFLDEVHDSIFDSQAREDLGELTRWIEAKIAKTFRPYSRDRDRK